MAKKYTFAGLCQAATSDNAPRFIKYKDDIYRWTGNDYVSTSSPDWSLSDSIFDGERTIISLNTDYIFETVDVVDLTLSERKMLEAFIDMQYITNTLKYIARREAHGTLMHGLCYINFVFTTKEDFDYVERFIIPSKFFKSMELDHQYTDVELGLFEEEED